MESKPRLSSKIFSQTLFYSNRNEKMRTTRSSTRVTLTCLANNKTRRSSNKTRKRRAKPASSSSSKKKKSSVTSSLSNELFTDVVELLLSMPPGTLHWKDALALGAVNRSCRRKWLDRQDALLGPQLKLLEDDIENRLYQENNSDDPRLEDNYSYMNVSQKLGALKNYKGVVEKRQFFAFAGVLLTYLEQRDLDMHNQAKTIIQEGIVEAMQGKGRQVSDCSDDTTSLEIRLKELVGQRYWDRAGTYLKRFMEDDQITLTSLSSTIFIPRNASLQEETKPTAMMSHDDDDDDEGKEEIHTKTPSPSTQLQQPEEKQDTVTTTESNESSSRLTSGTRPVSETGPYTPFFAEEEQEVTALWFMERVCVLIDSMCTEAVIQQINPDGMTATVKIQNKESCLTQIVQFHQVSRITPKVNDMVLALEGVDVGIEGELVCIDGPDGIIKDSNGEFKIIELVHLTKIIDIGEE